MKLNFRQFIEGDYDTFANDAGEGFWGNVAAGFLPIAKQTGKILLAHRSRYVNEPGTWGVWGGKIDDEHKMDLQGEAQREFEEETGYNGHMDVYPAYVFRSKEGGFEYHNFIAVIDKEFEPKYNWETDDHKWVTFEELSSLNPKHFGLEALLQHSGSIIKTIASSSKMPPPA